MDVQNSNASNMDPDWKKIERNMTKIGLKNGLSDGRELNFQQSFDKGYEDGLRNGFILGDLKFQSEEKKNLETLNLLENAKNGMCIVCTDEQENEDVAVVRRKQTEIVSLNIEKIKLNLDKS